MNKISKGLCALPLAIAVSVAAQNAQSDDNRIRFKHLDNQKHGDLSTYARVASPRDAILAAFKQPDAILTGNDIPFTPGNSRGNPGIALFDFDNDGDLDIYLTNGPGQANSLFSSQLAQTGRLIYKDVAIEAGVAAIEQDSMAACFGDIDNDGDIDLYVTGASEGNRLFANLGNGQFTDITDLSGTSDGEKNSLGCSFADVNSDGLLDLVVGNLYNNFEYRLPLMVPGFEDLKEHNSLFVNQGNHQFTDVSSESGIQNIKGATWAIAFVDLDKDGDPDLVTADDQGTLLPESVGGNDWGYVRIYDNDGTGIFTDITEQSGTNVAGDWMGLGFGDFNRDGLIDIFATNIGDYLAHAVGAGLGLPTTPGLWSSRWFTAQDNGVFIDSLAGALAATPFGWGVAVADFDLDSDHDIAFFGGADMAMLVDATNPGAVLSNSGSGEFQFASQAFDGHGQYARKTTHGVAAGDLNNDGLVDIVSVSSSYWPEAFPLAPMFPEPIDLGSEFDALASIWPTFAPHPESPELGFLWTGLEPENGFVAVELNRSRTAAGNLPLRVSLMGTAGILEGATTNRSAIGTAMVVHSQAGDLALPIVSGGSQASSAELQQTIAVSAEETVDITVYWTGGNQFTLYDVSADEPWVIPEIPCNAADFTDNRAGFVACVDQSLVDLQSVKDFSEKALRKIKISALKGYRQGSL